MRNYWVTEGDMNIPIQILSIVACIVVATGCSKTKSKDMQILAYGLWRVSNSSSVKDPSSPTGQIQLGEGYELVNQTDTIPAKLGSTFGLFFSIPKELRTKPLRLVYSFPEMTNPATGRTSRTFEVLDQDSGSRPMPGMFYDFTNPWELAVGEWTFQVFIDDRKMLEKKFNVVKAD